MPASRQRWPPPGSLSPIRQVSNQSGTLEVSARRLAPSEVRLRLSQHCPVRELQQDPLVRELTPRALAQ
eukprot:366236-Pyramimonas_sp.AAC.2